MTTSKQVVKKSLRDGVIGVMITAKDWWGFLDVVAITQHKGRFLPL